MTLNKKIAAIALIAVVSFVQGAEHKTDSTREAWNIRSEEGAGPQLASGSQIEIPLSVLKRDTITAVTAEIRINKDGKVEACSIESDRRTLLDSIVKASVLRSEYVPAYENGVAVPASLTVQIAFAIDSVFHRTNSIPPDIEGVILDRETKSPLRDAVINLQFIDSTDDPDVRIGFNRYLELIGRLPGQVYRKGIISTGADSSGRFAFKLLPFGKAVVAVQAEGHVITHFSENPQAARRTIVKYFLDKLERETRPSDTIMVYGIPAATEKINVEREQVAMGLTHCLSDLIVSRTAVRQVPEAPSMAIVRSGSPFDNRYFIATVPFLAPYHFGASSNSDINGMMISSMKDISIVLDRVAGRHPDVSGMLVEIDPGIPRPADPKLIKRPELVVDFSGDDADLQLSLPVAKRRDGMVQVAAKLANDRQTKWLFSMNGLGAYSAIGMGEPVGYRDYTLTTSHTIDSIRIGSFAWLAEDRYNVVDSLYAGHTPREKTVPWGMGSVEIKPLRARGVSFASGGSHQYFSEGKRVGLNAFLKKVDLSNAVIEARFDSLVTTGVRAGADFRAEYSDWSGSVIQRDPYGKDTTCHAGGRETEYISHGVVNLNSGPFTAGTDMAVSCIAAGTQSKVFYDAGLSLQYGDRNITAGLCAGRVTGRPDIRGLPDSLFRIQELHTYLFSLPVSLLGGRSIKAGIQPYYRIQDRCPQMDPQLYTWISSASTAMVAKGIDADIEYFLKKWAAFHTAVNFSSGRRITGRETSPYEWNIPFTLRAGSHLSFMDQRIHWYVDYSYSRGVRYFDFVEGVYKALPVYSRTDMSLQYRVAKVPHRYITRYDGYLNVYNISDKWNLRGYYWDTRMVRHGLYLGLMRLDLGLKAGFRL